MNVSSDAAEIGRRPRARRHLIGQGLETACERAAADQCHQKREHSNDEDWTGGCGGLCLVQSQAKLKHRGQEACHLVI